MCVCPRRVNPRLRWIDQRNTHGQPHYAYLDAKNVPDNMSFRSTTTSRDTWGQSGAHGATGAGGFHGSTKLMGSGAAGIHADRLRQMRRKAPDESYKTNYQGVRHRDHMTGALAQKSISDPKTKKGLPNLAVAVRRRQREKAQKLGPRLASATTPSGFFKL